MYLRQALFTLRACIYDMQNLDARNFRTQELKALITSLLIFYIYFFNLISLIYHSIRSQ